jgi:hypothetical protein
VKNSRGKTLIKVAAGGILLCGLVFCSYVVILEIRYRTEVRRAAAEHGIDPDSLEYAAHWPLDLYIDELASVRTLDEPERLVEEADSIVYFIVPVRERGRSVLVQAFFFGIGGRQNAVQVTFSHSSDVRVDGSDWLPDWAHRVDRAVADAWFENMEQADSTGPPLPRKQEPS